jgi:hypothetical protein
MAAVTSIIGIPILQVIGQQTGRPFPSPIWLPLIDERHNWTLPEPLTVNGSQPTLIDVYEELSCRMLARAKSWRADREGALQLYEAFCDGRAAWIVDQMRSWLEKALLADAALWLGELE